MSDEASSPAGGEVANYTPPLPADAPEIMSVYEAARSLTQSREAPQAPPPASETNHEARADAQLPEHELADEANADPLDAAPSEEPEAADPVDNLPPIEPPRSWVQEKKDQFRALPRELQQYVADRVQEQDRDFRTRQNEAVQQGKALQAQLLEVEQTKQKYEAGIQASLRALEREQLQNFPDIKTWEDVKALQARDPLRYQEWDLHQKELALVNAQSEEVRKRQAIERQTAWNNHIQAENEEAARHIPDLADEEKGKALRSRAEKRLVELGFKPDELAQMASGQVFLSIYDHRMQRLINSDLRLSEILKAKEAAVARPVPPVQRPGAARPGGDPSIQQQIKTLENQLSNASGNKAAEISAQIMRLERRAAAR